MKKLLLLSILLFFTACDPFFSGRRNMMPDEVFRQWQDLARAREYEKMFAYEYYNFENIIYSFNRYYRTRKMTWDSASNKEQQEFVKLYRSVLVHLLNQKNDDSYESLLRLKTYFQIRVTRYTVNLMNNTAELWVAGDYPGEEKIKLIRFNNRWYLINPFGYHSFVPVLRTLLTKK
ncbi:MAG: hypothetical protein PHF84_01595 [bacterium]|nr:hypothetical protein [bacterium]